ncbi:MAG: hypothetical protein Q9187_006651 [Circinaria calcarea]
MIQLAKNDDLEYSVCLGDNFMSKSEALFDDDGTDKPHFSILHAESSEAPGKIPLPKLIFEVGELFTRDLRKQSSEPQSTNYFVIIKPTTPVKPVWVLYDYTPVSPLGSREPVPLKAAKKVFKGVDSQFDAAQLLPELGDWVRGLSVDGLEEKVGASAITARATVKAASAQMVEKLLEKGWLTQVWGPHLNQDDAKREHEAELNRRREMLERTGVSEEERARYRSLW